MKTNMRRIAGITTLLVLTTLLAAASLAAADNKAKPADKDVFLGTWTVLEGVYDDGSLEKELDMSFTFKATTMTNPMDESEASWSLDEKNGTITSTGNGSKVTITYQLIDAKTVVFTGMVVTAKKTSTIIGKGGTFKSLKLVKKT